MEGGGRRKGGGLGTMAAAAPNEQRLLVGPRGVVGGAAGGSFLPAALALPCPRTGAALACFLSEGGEELVEVVRFKDPYTSWLVGESVVSDGSLYCLSPIDAAGLLYPALRAARARSGGFESAEQLLEDTVEGFPDVGKLAAAKCGLAAIEALCEAKHVGGESYYRLCDKRCLAWALCKAEDALEALKSSEGGKALAALPETQLRAYAVGMLEEYMPARLHTELREHLGVPKEVEVAKADGGAGTSANPFAGLAPEAAPREAFDDVGAEERAADARKARERAAAAAKREEAKAEKARRESAGMKSISSFFAKKPKK